VMERDYEKLERLFGTTHKIGDWEKDELVKENPEIIVIGTGQSNVMSVDGELINGWAKRGIEVIAISTPEAVEIYNEKIKQGKRVNALIHTTC
ncbi:MAG: MTH938/NDUFAF3 family protein, partial [Patescibacteria group bacterium]